MPPKSPTIGAIRQGRDHLLAVMEIARPGQTLAMKVKRKAGGDWTTWPSSAEAALPGNRPRKDPHDNALRKKKAGLTEARRQSAPAPAKERSEAKQAEEAEAEDIAGLMKQMDPAAVHTYWVYGPGLV